jgi:hypothetical protein
LGYKRYRGWWLCLQGQGENPITCISLYKLRGPGQKLWSRDCSGVNSLFVCCQAGPRGPSPCPVLLLQFSPFRRVIYFWEVAESTEIDRKITMFPWLNCSSADQRALFLFPSSMKSRKTPRLDICHTQVINSEIWTEKEHAQPTGSKAPRVQKWLQGCIEGKNKFQERNKWKKWEEGKNKICSNQ